MSYQPAGRALARLEGAFARSSGQTVLALLRLEALEAPPALVAGCHFSGSGQRAMAAGSPTLSDLYEPKARFAGVGRTRKFDRPIRPTICAEHLGRQQTRGCKQ